MNFTRIDADAISGTSLQGHVETSYDQLVATFGEPDGPSGDGKVRVEWDVRFENGAVATIYDWKQYGVAVEDVTEWNVGGERNLWVVEQVMDAIEERKSR